MHLKDDTLANRLGSGITLKSSFDVKPGGYRVRLVVRDLEGQISATMRRSRFLKKGHPRYVRESIANSS